MNTLMKSSHSTGLYLFPKALGHQTSLKEMLQYLRAHAPGKGVQFAYVECETALIPNLTLWENLQMVMGGLNWHEAMAQMNADCQSLASLISDPQIPGHAASSWEKLAVALIKGVQTNSQHLLIDLNEEMHAPLNLANLKKILPLLSQRQSIFLASAESDYWIDISHGIIRKEGYQFQVEDLTNIGIKTRRPA